MANVISMQHNGASLRSSVNPAAGGRTPSGKLLYKLLVVFLCLSIVPLIWAGFALINVSDNYIQKESRGVKLGIAQKVAGNVAAYLANVKNILEVVQKSNDLLAANPKRRAAILGNVMDAYPLFMRLEVIDLNGRELSAGNLLCRASHTLAICIAGGHGAIAC